MLKVHSIETFGTHDGPGIRLVIFTQGCPFRCAYCHNPDSQTWNNPKAIELTAEDIIERLQKEKPYFKNGGGVTFSGGEPTLQTKELLPICQQIKQAGFHITLDTCGGIFTEETQQLYDLCDLVMLDVKHINRDWHVKLTKHSNDTVLKNAHYREQTGKELWLRYVLVPGWTDQDEYLKEWAQYFSDFKSITKAQILPYHLLGVHKYAELGLDYILDGVRAATESDAQRAKKIFEKHLKAVEIA
ncbi:MAG: pyruvate formate-lyase-activating enzyme [Patescibacteria group bacterium]|nr:MAG: pyruvate formate-lyase-activating enzyme [Patescibacteria group bacterium]